MRLRDGEVLATRASRGLAPHRIGGRWAAVAGTHLLAINTVSPLTHSQRKSGLGEHARVSSNLLLHVRAPESRATREDLCPHAPAEWSCAQHELPSGHGLIEDCSVDLAVELIVGANVTLVCLADIAMAEMLRQCVDRRAIAKRDEACES